MALGISQNTREIIHVRQNLLASQDLDARAAARNASLVQDLGSAIALLHAQGMSVHRPGSR